MPNDIRSDRRPLKLKHRSGRGKPPRNSGNFTRGSQLFSHGMRMWFSGVKVPIITWGVLFFLAYSVILSLTLNENNVQLICMRVLAWLWHWIGFDETKAVDLLMPDGSRRRTIMGLVPHVGEVIRAWNKAVRGLIGSLLLATFGTVLLTTWFVIMPVGMAPLGCCRTAVVSSDLRMISWLQRSINMPMVRSARLNGRHDQKTLRHNRGMKRVIELVPFSRQYFCNDLREWPGNEDRGFRARLCRALQRRAASAA